MRSRDTIFVIGDDVFMRVTQHSGRVNKGGKAFSARHNDRNYDVEKADNIDKTKINQNMYWSLYGSGWYRENTKEKKPTFEQVEKDFYKRRFKKQYDAQVERYREKRQYKRIKPFDEWRKARQYCPEELYLQIGNVDETVDPKTFMDCAGAYLNKMIEWNKVHGRPFTVLDCAMHMDEDVPQIHIRRVWHSIDPDTGIDEIGQNKALERAGVELPDPYQPCGQHNNRKMTFDKYMRTAWIEICKSYGLDIEEVPEQGVKHNQTKAEYVDAKQRKARKQLQDDKKTLEAEKADFERQKAEYLSEIEEARKQALKVISDAEMVLEDAKSAFNSVNSDMNVLPKRKEIDQRILDRVTREVERVKFRVPKRVPEKSKEKDRELSL